MHEKLGEQMIGFDLYIEYINFKRVMAKFVEKFEMDAKDRFSYRFHQTNTGGKAENYNRFRKCPHCGIIWYKVNNCPNTSCGAILDTPDIFTNGDTICGYIFKWIGNKLTWVKDDQSSFVKIKRVAESYKSQRQAEPQGCKKSICWDDCEDVTDLVMSELKQAQIRDFVAAGNHKENFTLSDALKFQDVNYTPPANSDGVVTVPVSSNTTSSPAPPVSSNTTSSPEPTPIQHATSKKEFIIRKLNLKRGGYKIRAESIQEILQLGKTEFKKEVICVREGDDEVKITDFTLLKEGSKLYLTTAEEEKEFE